MITNEKNSEVEKASAQTQNQKEASQTHQSLYAALLHIQLWVVLQRTWLYWREPDYMVSKLWMNIGYTLVNGLTYLQSSNSQLGVYHRVFSDFMALIVGPPLGLQVQPRFVTLREIFMHRERESLSYHWITLVVSTFIVELPFTFITLLFSPLDISALLRVQDTVSLCTSFSLCLKPV